MPLFLRASTEWDKGRSQGVLFRGGWNPAQPGATWMNRTTAEALTGDRTFTNSGSFSSAGGRGKGGPVDDTINRKDQLEAAEEVVKTPSCAFARHRRGIIVRSHFIDMGSRGA